MKTILILLILLSIFAFESLKAQTTKGIHTDTLTLINGFINWRAEGAGINFKKSKTDSIFYGADPSNDPTGLKVETRTDHNDSLWYLPADQATYYIKKRFVGRRFIVTYNVDSIENPITGNNMLGINSISKMVLIK